MRRGMLALVLAALLGSGMGAPVQSAEELFDTKKASEHLTKGIDAIRAKNYDKAIAELEDAVNINPDAESFYFLGYAYYLKGKVTGDAESRKLSRENFDKAYELDPQYSPTGLGQLPAIQPRQQPAAQPAVPAPAAPAQITEESTAGDADDERVFRGSYQSGQESAQDQRPAQPAPAPLEQQPAQEAPPASDQPPQTPPGPPTDQAPPLAPEPPQP